MCCIFKQLLVEFWYWFYDSTCFSKNFLKTLHKSNCHLLALWVWNPVFQNWHFFQNWIAIAQTFDKSSDKYDDSIIITWQNPNIWWNPIKLSLWTHSKSDVNGVLLFFVSCFLVVGKDLCYTHLHHKFVNNFVLMLMHG